MLKPNILRWLQQSFEPPLTPFEPANNPGRLVLSHKKILEWIASGAKIMKASKFEGIPTPGFEQPVSMRLE